MLLRLLRIPREVAQALLRTLFAARDATSMISPPPRVRLVVPEPIPDEPALPLAMADVLSLLQETASYRTADELAASLRRRGHPYASAHDVREALEHEGARHVEVRLRDEPGGKVAEFRARPTA